jgi:DNA mismatch repair protein MutS2
MNNHALAVLEFQRVLELVAARATSGAGARCVHDLAPHNDIAALELEHGRVAAMRVIVEREGGWIPQPIPDLEHVLGRLRLIDATLSAEDFVRVLTALRSGRLTRASLSPEDRPVAELAALALLAPDRDALLADVGSETAIERVVTDDGTVKDGASPALRRIRRELRSAESELIALLERIMQQLDPRLRVPDASVTVRNGRYVIPVRREGRNAVGGLVHDASSSGATLFVEPPAAIERCNQIRELEADETREIDRILRELTEQVRPLFAQLSESVEALTRLDALYARALFSRDFRCGRITLVRPGSGFRILEARHPLLMEQGIAVVPFDLEMGTEELTLLVSGPNTGGKTVLLKTIALLSAMVQSGIPVPATSGSAIVVYDNIFADVGDEQSIEASLSTFSAHLKNIAEILRGADVNSLVLLDELGSGTDPLEGAALGGAVLEDLTRRRAMTIATTHLGALKELATEVRGIVNASLQFDAEALAPTYQLIKGQPGRSYGISIARRLGLPADVLLRAEERVPKVERDVNALLASLEQRSAELATLLAHARETRDSAREWAHRLAERETGLRGREQTFERESRQEARRYLLEARAEVERTIKALRGTSSESRDQAIRVARQRIEYLAEEQRQRLDDVESASSASGADVPQSRELRPGDLVRLRALGGRAGRVIELRDGECVVAIGDVKMTFPVDEVARTSDVPAEPEMSVSIRGRLPEPEAVTEIDVRGVRAAEIDEIVMQALDAAVRADLPALRIIHGKGTGALRERVTEMLRKDIRVKGFRVGAWNEGGAGVTVAEL